jgi:hypothetical protein
MKINLLADAVIQEAYEPTHHLVVKVSVVFVLIPKVPVEDPRT